MRPAYYEFRHVVTFADTNLVGNVYFASYLAWQGACRERFLADKAPEVVPRLGADLVLVTLSCSCDFLSELFALDVVSVRMSLAGMDWHRITMDFGYYRANDAVAQLVARGRQSVACMARTGTGLEPVPIPDGLRTALNAYASC